MEYTRDTAEELITAAIEAVRTADFVAMDTELTGLAEEAWAQSTKTDTCFTRYARCRAARRLRITQYGLSTFQWDESESVWRSRTFSMHMFPADESGSMVVEPSAFRFLQRNGFNFHKWVRGAPYLSRAAEAAIWGTELAASESRATEEYGEDLTLDSADEVEDIDAQRVRLIGFLEACGGGGEKGEKVMVDEDSGLPCCVLPARQARMRRLLHELVRREFPGCVTVERREDREDGVPNYMKSIRVLCLKPSKPMETVAKETLEAVRRGKESGDKVGIVETERQEEMQEMQEWKYLEHQLRLLRKEKSLREQVGVRRIVDAISRRGCPVVVHNGMLDLTHSYEHFVASLPKSCDEFARRMRELYPVVLDTKQIISSEDVLRAVFPSTGLGGAFATATGHRFADEYLTAGGALPWDGVDVRIVRENDGEEDGQNRVAHDAGWDAFMTGALLARVVGRLGLAPAGMFAACKSQFPIDWGQSPGEGDYEEAPPPTTWDEFFARHGNVVHLMRSRQYRWSLTLPAAHELNAGSVSCPRLSEPTSSEAEAAAAEEEEEDPTSSEKATSSEKSSSSSECGPNASVVVVHGLTRNIREPDLLAMVESQADLEPGSLSRKKIAWGQDAAAFIRLPSVEVATRLLAKVQAETPPADPEAERLWLESTLSSYSTSLPSGWLAHDAARLSVQEAEENPEHGDQPWAVRTGWRAVAWQTKTSDSGLPPLSSFHVQSYAAFLRSHPNVFPQECFWECRGAPDASTPTPSTGTKRPRLEK